MYVTTDEEVVEDDIETDFANLKYSINIQYEIKSITKKKDSYIINTYVTAKGTTKGFTWNVKNADVAFEIKKLNNHYKIVKTNMFENIGNKNAFSPTLKGILKFGLICIEIVFIFVIIIIIKNRKGKIK